MQYTRFNSAVYKWLLLAFLSGLIIWNLYLVVQDQAWLALISAACEGVIIYLILTQHKYVKNVIKWWAAIFFIVPSLLRLFGLAVPDPVIGFVDMEAYENWRHVRLTIGLAISIFADKTLELVGVEEVVLSDEG